MVDKEIVQCLFEDTCPDVIITDNGVFVVKLPSQTPGHEIM